MSANPVDFSVIIAVYNGAGTIARAIDSVLQQSYPVRELIVVNDGSTDNTLEVLQAYGSRINLIDQSNAGVAASRNRGVAAATSSWVAFLDADDYYYPDRIDVHARWIAQDHTLDFLTGDFDYVTAEGAHIRHSLESCTSGLAMLALADSMTRAILPHELYGDFIAHHFGDTHTLSMRRDVFMDLGGYPTEFAVCEDVNLLVRLLLRSRKVGVICKPIAAYVIHENSATRSDPVRAQKQTVAALERLRANVSGAPKTLRVGLERAIQEARYDLAVALLRVGDRFTAVASCLPPLYRYPRWRSLRALVSVLRG